MRFPVEMDIDQSEPILRKFIAIAGWSYWEKRAKELANILRANPLLKDYLLTQYGIEFALFEVIDREKNTGRFPAKIHNFAQYRLFSLAAITTSFFDRLDKTGQERLRGMIKDGLKSDDGLNGLEHEMTIAGHCIKSGFDVVPLDLMGKGRVDYLIEKDNLQAELECKLFGPNIGQPITQRPMVELSNQLLPMLKEMVTKSNTGYFVDVRLFGRLDEENNYDEIVAVVKQALHSGANQLSPKVARLLSEQFSIQDTHILPEDNHHAFDLDTIRGFVKDKFGLDNEHMFVLAKPNRSVVIIAVTSEKPLRLLRRAYDRLKEAAEDQLSGALPGLIVVKYPSLSSDELRNLASLQSKHGHHNAFRLIATRLFRGNRRKHLHTVAFISSGQIRRQELFTSPTLLRKSIAEEGASYVFVNHEHPISGDSRLNLFRL